MPRAYHPNHRIGPLILVLLGLAGLGMPSAAGEAARPPNVIVVLADDLGYGDVSCYFPAGKIATPCIDALAGQGMRFTDAHSGSSVCSPSRYGLLTGRYAWRVSNMPRALPHYASPPMIAAGRATLASLLGRQGYVSACFGKWHVGWTWPKRADGEMDFTQPIGDGPITRGFSTFFGTDAPNYPPYCFIAGDRTVGLPTARKERDDLDGKPGAMLPGWAMDRIMPTLVERSVAWIGERAVDRKPFLLYLSLTSPHEPIAPSPPFRGKSGISPLADFIIETDAALGSVVAALDRHGLAQDTLLIFTSDNGHATYTGLKELQQAGHEPSGPLRGYKMSIAEGGHRIPFVARWPGVTRPGTVCDTTICLTDVFATCAEAA